MWLRLEDPKQINIVYVEETSLLSQILLNTLCASKDLVLCPDKITHIYLT